MSTSFTYQKIVQICNWAMLTNQVYEARPGAPLQIGNPWQVQTRAGHDQPWVNFDLTNVNMTAVTNFLTINCPEGGHQLYGPAGLSPTELAAIVRYLTAVGGYMYARADGDRILTSNDGQSWSVYETSTEFNFPAAQAAVIALLGHP